MSGENISAPKMRNNFWCTIKFFILFKYCYSNIGLFTIATNIVIALITDIAKVVAFNLIASIFVSVL